MDSLDGSRKEEGLSVEGEGLDEALMDAKEKAKAEPIEGSQGELNVGEGNGKPPSVATLKVLREYNSDHEYNFRRLDNRH